MKSKSGERGFTLLEAMVVLFGAMLLAAALVPDYGRLVMEDRAHRAILETANIGDAAKAWQLANGEWPDAVNACADAINQLRSDGTLTAAAGFAGNNPFSQIYVTSCTADTFVIVQDVDADWAGFIVAALPVTRSLDADTVETSYPLPGARSPALIGSPDGSSPASRMTTALGVQSGLTNIRNYSGDTVTVTTALPWSRIHKDAFIENLTGPALLAGPSGWGGGSTSLVIADPDIECTPVGSAGFVSNFSACVLAASGPHALDIPNSLSLSSTSTQTVRLVDVSIGSPSAPTIINGEDFIFKFPTYSARGVGTGSFDYELTSGSRRYVTSIVAVDFSSSLSVDVSIPACPSGFTADVDTAPGIHSFCNDTSSADSFARVISSGVARYTYSPSSGGACPVAEYPKGFVKTYCTR